MKIEVKQIHSKKELEQFVKFHIELYKNNPCAIPPLMADEIKALDTAVNPAFQSAKAFYFLAMQNKKIVGRIAGIINFHETEQQHIKKLRFAYFDAIDDLKVSQALFEKLYEIAKDHGLDHLEGPMGATSMEKAGLLTEGFDQMATVIGQYNFAYYATHLEKLGFVPEKEWLEMRINAPESIPEKIYSFSDLVTKRYGLKLVRLKTKADLRKYIQPVFNLLEISYSELESYVPITDKQKAFYAEKYANILSPDFITIIEDEAEELIAFAIVMPSFAKALQKAKGKLLPWGWYHLLKAQKKNDTAEFVLIGVHPKFQKKGITAIIFKEMHETFKRNNIQFLETNPELEANQSVQLLWKDYDPVIHKRRKTFRKEV